MKYKHIFFDLDRTLWDFEKNSTRTLTELIIQFNLIEKGVSSTQDFIKRYRLHNEKLWDLYREDKITKNQLRGSRFLLTLKEYGIGAQILVDLGVRKMRLMTNSPVKIRELEAVGALRGAGLDGYGLEVVERVPIEVKANPHNISYLAAKRDKMGHLFEQQMPGSGV